jgi:rubredoxin
MSKPQNWIDANDYRFPEPRIDTKGTRVKKSREKENSSILTGFKCAGHKCVFEQVWNVNGFAAAKKIALTHGWSFGDAKILCPVCTAAKERIARRKHSPVRPQSNPPMTKSIFKN